MTQPERCRSLSPVYPSRPGTAAAVAGRRRIERALPGRPSAAGRRLGRGCRLRGMVGVGGAPPPVLPPQAERRPSPLAVWRLASRPPRRAANGRRAAPPPRAWRADAGEFPRGTGGWGGRRPPAPSSDRGAVRRRRVVRDLSAPRVLRGACVPFLNAGWSSKWK